MEVRCGGAWQLIAPSVSDRDGQQGAAVEGSA